MMNKELTPLEALKEIEQYNFGGIKDFSKHIAIIETALKALEIIKEKGLSFIEIALLKCCNDYSEYECEIAGRCYKSSFENNKAHKTKEEFDLLKEVLKHYA